MRVMGQDPMKAGAFREYLRVLRALLHGEEVDYELNGERQRRSASCIADRGFIDVEHPVPIYVAADGPLALKAAGAYGDGRVCSHNQTRARLQKSLETMQQGASAVGRTLPDDFHTAALTYACVLRPGESTTSDRVIDAIGPMAAATLHYWWELYQKDGDTSTVASAAATCGTSTSPSPRRWRRRSPSATSRSISAIAPSCRRRSAASSPRT